MNSKRKADLQRKLSMASVPKPPAGLAERIKQDIPEFLRTEPERQRFSKLLTVNMRVAASILLLVSSTYICLQILSRAPMERGNSSAPVAMAARAAKSIAVPQGPPPELRQRVIAPNVPPPVAPQRVANEVPPASFAERIVLHRDAPADNDKKENDERKDDGRFMLADSMTETRAGEAQAQAAPAPPPPPPVAQAEPAPSVTAAAPALAATETIAVFHDGQRSDAAGASAKLIAKTARTEVVRSAVASSLDFAARNQIFGISVNGSAFDQVKTAIERGEHPSHVDVEALVNYFAGTASRSPREVSLEVEGSPAPIDAAQTVFVRYTIDTARDSLPSRAFVRPIATDARVQIAFDPQAVASYHRIGGDEPSSASESSLLENASVTALYAVQLQPRVTRRMQVAEVTLHYKNVINGDERDIIRRLNVADVTRPWSSASRRHRLASLGAVWGEQLKSSTSGVEVARRAEELAKQEPQDERARALAALANAAMPH